MLFLSMAIEDYIKKKIDVNSKTILNQIFLWHSKSNILMTFQINYFNKIIIYFYYTALHFAAENNNIEIVKLLLANPNIKVSFYSIFKCYIF